MGDDIGLHCALRNKPNELLISVPCRRRFVVANIVLLVIAALAAFWVAGTRLPGLLSRPDATVRPPELANVLLPSPRPLQDFALLSDDGRRFEMERLRGNWTMMFFGYTSCPDICPTTLVNFRDVADLIASDQAVQYVFVTVDPSRDDLESIGQYVKYFHKDIIGVGGEPAELESLMNQLNVMALRESREESGGYTISHTSSIMLIDPQGRLVGAFSPPHRPGRIAEQFQLLRDYFEEHQ